MPCDAFASGFAARLNTNTQEKCGAIGPKKTPLKTHRVTNYGTPIRTSREPAAAKNRGTMRVKKYWRETTIVGA